MRRIPRRRKSPAALAFAAPIALLAGILGVTGRAIPPSAAGTPRGRGAEFEKDCYYWLVSLGWSVRAVGRSGDQGCDLVARKGTRVVAIQCKAYAKPVGNRAVQEVYAAAAHYRANGSAVIAPNGFTASAQQLARTTGVRLLGPASLSGL